MEYYVSVSASNRPKFVAGFFFLRLLFLLGLVLTGKIIPAVILYLVSNVAIVFAHMRDAFNISLNGSNNTPA